MAEAFDPYYEWLGIPGKDQPPNHYRLLGIEVFEENPNVIERAADRQMSHVRTFQVGKHGKESQQLLNALSAARLCLLHDQKKQAYDEQLRGKLATAGPAAADLADGDLPPVAALSLEPISALKSAGESPLEPTSDPESVGKESPADKNPFDFRPREPANRLTSPKLRRAKQEPLWQQPLLKWSGAGALAVVFVVALVVMLTSSSPSDRQESAEREGEPGGEFDQPKANIDDLSTQPLISDLPATRSKRFLAVDESLHVPTDPALEGPWPAASPELSHRIERAVGMLEEDFALCQTMLLDQFIQTARALRPGGYRPIRVRPYLETGEVHVAAVWARDGLPWRMAVAPNAESVLKTDKRLRQQDFHAVDVAGVRLDGDRFLALWAKRAETPLPTQLTVGVAVRDLKSRARRLRKQKYTPLTRQAFVATGGDVQTCQVWAKLTPVPSWDQFVGSADDLQRTMRPDRFPLDLSLRPDLGGGGQFLCAYLNESERSFKRSTGLSLRQHREQCHEFAALGYRPAAIGVANVGAPTSLVAVSIWHMPDQPPAKGLAEGPEATPPASRAAPIEAQQSHALRFAGRDRVVLQNTQGLADMDRNFTAEAWVRLSIQSPLSAHYVMGNGAMQGFHPKVTAAGLAGWFLILQPMPADPSTAGMMILRIGKQNGSDGPNGQTTPLGSDWHHVAICNEALPDGAFRFTLFCDGRQVLQQSRSREQVFQSPEGFYLGSAERNPPAVSFHGDVRAFRLSSRARYQGTFEPSPIFTTGDSVLALLAFAGGDAGQIRDLSGHNRHGQIEGPQWVDLAREPEPSAAAVVTEKRKPPLPDAATRRAAIQKAKDDYRSELVAAKEPGEVTILAGQLLVKASEESDPTKQLQLLSLAHDLAIQALDVQLALRSVDELAERFEFDSWAKKAETFIGLRGSARENPDLRTIAELALDLHVEAVDAEAFVAANKILETVRNAGRRLNDINLKSLANRLGNQLEQDMRAQEQASSARRILTTNPTDADANQALGKYLCFSRNHWEQGLIYLEQGKDGLGELARRDRQTPAQPPARLELAKAWHTWADAKRGLDQNGGWIRARHWYQLALPDLTGPDKAQVEEHLDALSGKVLSKDVIGTRLSFLDVEAGEVKRLQGHTSAATCLAISRSGRLLVSGSLDDTVRVWDLMKGESIGTITAEVGDVVGVVLASDDQFVTIFGKQGKVEKWNVQAGIKSASYKLSNPVRHIAVSGDGGRLLWARTGTAKDNLSLVALGQPGGGQSLTCPTEPTAISLSSSGRLAAASDANNVVYAWDLLSPKQLGPFTGLTDRITHIAISPNERLLAASTASVVIVWNVSTGRELKRFQERNEAFARITFSRDCRRLLTSGRTNQVSTWDIDSGAKKHGVSGGGRADNGVSAIAYLPDDRGAATAGSDGLVRIWRLPD